jgi:hypothetical protein
MIACSLAKPRAWLPPLALLALLGFADAARAEGTDIGKPWFFGAGIACDASLLPWPSVWLGHFSGGTASYVPGAPAASVTWEDKKLCFPSRRECMQWQRAERRQFNGIEGYWTCLLLR